jgi:hypothetical protein
MAIVNSDVTLKSTIICYFYLTERVKKDLISKKIKINKKRSDPEEKLASKARGLN